MRPSVATATGGRVGRSSPCRRGAATARGRGRRRLLVWQPWADDEPAAVGRTTTTAATATDDARRRRAGRAGVGDPYYPGLGNGGFDVEHYTLDLTWLADQGALEGVATIEATATQDLSRFDLDLSGLEVRAVTVDGERGRGRPAKDASSSIDPAARHRRGRRVHRRRHLRRASPSRSREGTDVFDLGWQTDGREAFVVSEPSGAQTFFPVSDHPTDKATYTFRVTAPEDQTVAANGLLVGENDTGHGTRSWTYEASDPMASYLVQIAIGDYELVDAGKVRRRHDPPRLPPVAGSTTPPRPTAGTAEMIDAARRRLRPVPVRGLRRAGGRRGPRLRARDPDAHDHRLRHRGRRAATPTRSSLHELAHQWVGDAVSPATWKDIWLNEGFATYAEWLWLERTGQQLRGRLGPRSTRASPSSTHRRATRGPTSCSPAPSTSGAG